MAERSHPRSLCSFTRLSMSPRAQVARTASRQEPEPVRGMIPVEGHASPNPSRRQPRASTALTASGRRLGDHSESRSCREISRIDRRSLQICRTEARIRVITITLCDKSTRYQRPNVEASPRSRRRASMVGVDRRPHRLAKRHPGLRSWETPALTHSRFCAGESIRAGMVRWRAPSSSRGLKGRFARFAASMCTSSPRVSKWPDRPISGVDAPSARPESAPSEAPLHDPVRPAAGLAARCAG